MLAQALGNLLVVVAFLVHLKVRILEQVFETLVLQQLIGKFLLKKVGSNYTAKNNLPSCPQFYRLP